MYIGSTKASTVRSVFLLCISFLPTHCSVVRGPNFFCDDDENASVKEKFLGPPSETTLASWPQERELCDPLCCPIFYAGSCIRTWKLYEVLRRRTGVVKDKDHYFLLHLPVPLFVV